MTHSYCTLTQSFRLQRFTMGTSLAHLRDMARLSLQLDHASCTISAGGKYEQTTATNVGLMLCFIKTTIENSGLPWTLERASRRTVTVVHYRTFLLLLSLPTLIFYCSRFMNSTSHVVFSRTSCGSTSTWADWWVEASLLHESQPRAAQAVCLPVCAGVELRWQSITSASLSRDSDRQRKQLPRHVRALQDLDEPGKRC